MLVKVVLKINECENSSILPVRLFQTDECTSQRIQLEHIQERADFNRPVCIALQESVKQWSEAASTEESLR